MCLCVCAANLCVSTVIWWTDVYVFDVKVCFQGVGICLRNIQALSSLFPSISAEVSLGATVNVHERKTIMAMLLQVVWEFLQPRTNHPAMLCVWGKHAHNIFRQTDVSLNNTYSMINRATRYMNYLFCFRCHPISLSVRTNKTNRETNHQYKNCRFDFRIRLNPDQRL